MADPTLEIDNDDSQAVVGDRYAGFLPVEKFVGKTMIITTEDGTEIKLHPYSQNALLCSCELLASGDLILKGTWLVKFNQDTALEVT